MKTRIPVEKLSVAVLKNYCRRNYTHFTAEQSVLARSEYQLDENTAAIGFYQDKYGDSNYRILICQNGLLILDSDSKHFVEFETIYQVPYNFLDNKISLMCQDGSTKTVSITGLDETGADMYIFYKFFTKILFWCDKKRERQNAGLE